MTKHNFYRITKYGIKLLESVGITKKVIREAMSDNQPKRTKEKV
jgi:hypothetical protein